MSRSHILLSRALVQNDGAVANVFIAGSGIANVGTVAQAQNILRVAGVLSHLYVRVTANSVTVDSSIITLQKTAADTAITVSYLSDQTGVKTDTSNFVSVAADDKFSYTDAIPAEAGANTITIAIRGLLFTASDASQCVTVMSCSGSGPLSTASTPFFMTPSGRLATNETVTEANTKYRVRGTFTASGLYTYANANARTTDTVCKTRKNGADGAQSVTYTSGQTGAKSDTSNSDSLAAGDDFNYSVVTGTGTGNFTHNVISTSWLNTANIFALLGGEHNATQTIGPSTTEYFPVGGSLVTGDTTEANAQFVPPVSFVASELGSFVSANTNAISAATVTLRLAGADGTLTVTYTALQTGLKNDSAHTDPVLGGTTALDYAVTNADAAGTVTITWLGILGTNIGNPWLPYRQQMAA